MARPKKSKDLIVPQSPMIKPFQTISVIPAGMNKFVVRVMTIRPDLSIEMVQDSDEFTMLEAREQFKIASVKLFWGENT